jgi:hypothetical protein
MWLLVALVLLAKRTGAVRSDGGTLWSNQRMQAMVGGLEGSIVPDGGVPLCLIGSIGPPLKTEDMRNSQQAQ